MSADHALKPECLTRYILTSLSLEAYYLFYSSHPSINRIIMNILASMLTLSLGNLLLYIVWLLGIAFALGSWYQHPRVSLLTVIALSGFIVLTLTHTFLVAWLPTHLSPSQVGIFFGISGVATSIVAAGLWGMILVAILGSRSKGSSE
jgi:uncharacterized membrane protein